MPILKPIDKITEADLLKLTADAEPESQTLEYKRDVSFKPIEALVEFLRDVSALANSEGGDLIIGMEEVDGQAKEITGTSCHDIESLESTITAHCLKHLVPPLGGIQYKIVGCHGKSVLIVRVPQSWMAPHQLICNGDHRFYLRRGREKLTMTTDELKRSFGFAESGAQRLKSFREQRVQNAACAVSSASLVIHLMPLKSFMQSMDYDVAGLLTDSALNFDMPSAWDRGFNFDGILMNRVGGPLARAQIFRSGSVEFVLELGVKDHSGIDAHKLARLIGLYSKYAFEVLSSLGASQPILVGVSLIRVANRKLWAFQGHDGPVADRDRILVPEVVSDTVTPERGTLVALLAPILNILAQSFGNRAWNKWGPWGDAE